MRPQYRSTFLMVVAVAAFLAGPALGPSPSPSLALADDAEDSEKGDAAPTVPPLMEFNDRDLTIAIKLPHEWTVEKGPHELPTLAYFAWPRKEGGQHAHVEVLLRRRYAQPELARQSVQRNRGEIVEGTLRRGKDFSESCMLSSKTTQALFDRFVVTHGFVYQVRFTCHESRREAFTALATAIMDTFEVRKPHTVPDMPKEWRRSKHKPYTVWCDDDDKATPGRVMRPVFDVRRVLQKALKGDPVDPLSPTVRMYRTPARYDKDCTALIGRTQDTSAYDSDERVLLIELMDETDHGFAWSVQQMAALQYVHQYFGGTVPLWIRRGLMMYGTIAVSDSAGKAAKPSRERTHKVKGLVIASSLRLDQYFEMQASDVTDDERSFDDLWAWHWFLRHAKGSKTYRKTYTKCLQILHATGDLEAAHAAWEGTDFRKLQSARKDWAKTLK